jgi:signal transduction histidine kinase
VLLLEADPANEAQEAWDDLAVVLVTFVLFAALAMLCLGRVITVALRPLEALAAACERMGAGDFTALRLDRRPAVREFAERLAEAEAHDRRLRERLETRRETGRAAIARDLHDEISP